MVEVDRIVERLEEFALLSSLAGESSFVARAYTSAADLVSGQQTAFPEFLTQVQAGKIRGVGSGIAKFLQQASLEDDPPELVELRARVPKVLRELVQVPGIGPKKALAIFEALKPDRLEDVHRACGAGRMQEVKGFGEKSAQALKAGLEFRFSQRGLLRLDQATELLAGLDATATGALRRALPIVDELQVISADPETLKKTIVERVEALGTVGVDELRLSIQRRTAADPGLQECYAIGPARFMSELEKTAQGRGLELSAQGFFGPNGKIVCVGERDVFAALGLPYVVPELRDLPFDDGCAAAQTKLVELGDIKGLMHVHSTDSDGVDSVQALADAARTRGFQYLVISDHSRSAVYAHGLSSDRVRYQHETIDALNARLAPFRIFKGIESDILHDGSLDYDELVLERFEVVICSIHGRFKCNREQMTDRICRALTHPRATVLGHSCGRLLLQRPAYELDYERVFETAAKHRVAIEINANPRRLDLDWELVAQAKALGISFPVCPDAHSIAEFDNQRWGVLNARKAGLEAGQVLNCKALGEFETWLQARRR